MLIPVILKNGHEELVSKDELQLLMSNKQVLFFKRTNGWVVFDQDKVREKNIPYSGVERRQPNITH